MTTHVETFLRDVDHTDVNAWSGGGIDLAIAKAPNVPIEDQIIKVDIDGASYDIEIKRTD